MVRKTFALCIMIALVLGAADVCAASGFSNSLFEKGKDAVNLIAYGDYAKAIKKLAMAKNEPSAEDFATFVEEELGDIFSGVQTNVAVAYYLNDRWVLAIPVNEPWDDSVQVLLLSSVDGKEFDGYRASSWKNVQSNVDKCTDVIWNVEYEPETPAVYVDE